MIGPPVRQVVTIERRATGFNVLCDRCAQDGSSQGWVGSTFSGRLDLDLDLDLECGIFLCRNGHAVRVQRVRATAGPASTVAA